jgi:hypothetical protein
MRPKSLLCNDLGQMFVFTRFLTPRLLTLEEIMLKWGSFGRSPVRLTIL